MISKIIHHQWPILLLRYGLRIRYVLSGGILRDNPNLDAVCGIPMVLQFLQFDLTKEYRILLKQQKKEQEELAIRNNTADVDGSTRRRQDEEQDRIQLFETYLRPALVSNNRWTDVQIWQFHFRLIKWLRTEYLRMKYRPILNEIVGSPSTLTTSTSHRNTTSQLYTTIRKSPQLNKDCYYCIGSEQQQHQTQYLSLIQKYSFTAKLFESFRSYFVGSSSNHSHQVTGSNEKNEKSVVENVSPSLRLWKRLPYTATLIQAFDMTDWEKYRKNLPATRTNMKTIVKERMTGGTILEIRGGSIGIAHFAETNDIADTSSTSTSLTTNTVENLSLEEIIEVAGGHIQQCNAFNAVCEHRDIYQFWTREYIDILGRYLIRRSILLQQQQQQPYATAPTKKEIVILDVGAGDGLLAQLLREFINAEWYNSINNTSGTVPISSWKQTHTKITGNESMNKTRIKLTVPTIVASDSGAWGISPIAPVVKQTVEEAINAYTATTTSTSQQYHVIVLCSWMPMNTDWTRLFRQNVSNNTGVDEYILIGECDDGQCGDNWLTWGNIHHIMDETDIIDSSDSSNITGTAAATTVPQQQQTSSSSLPLPTPHYRLDGYERYDLNELAPYQFSRFDCRTSKTGRTVSFRKQTAGVSQ